MRKTLALLLAAAGIAAAAAGCGSSSKAAGIQTAPGAGPTSDSTTATVASSTTTSSSTATVPTPSSGALSKEPAVIKQTGPAPKTVVTKDLVTGTGATAKAGATITVNYVGYLYKTDKIFDASWNRKQTFTTALSTSAIIPGWVKGIPGMKVGGRREIIIPAVDGYGKAGQGSTIPPNSPLVFIVDLLKVS